MNILNKIRLFFVSLFSGLSKADNIIIGQSIDSDDKVIPAYQEKDTQRVANHLLKGEVTQEVKELRYRDYLVSENSRHYSVVGDTAIKNARISYSPKRFGGLNHNMGLALGDMSKLQDALKKEGEYTLKFKYEDTVRYNLSKFCTHFYIDLKNNKVSLYFDLLPNRNISTSKAFIHYIQQTMVSPKLGGEFNFIKEMWFVSYKISALQNYLKFTFKDMILKEIKTTDKELILEYTPTTYTMEDLIEKYKVEDLDKKYKEKAPKQLPTSDIESSIYTLSKCEICGKEVNQNEAKLNSYVVGKYCCSDCVFEESAKQGKDEFWKPDFNVNLEKLNNLKK